MPLLWNIGTVTHLSQKDNTNKGSKFDFVQNTIKYVLLKSNYLVGADITGYKILERDLINWKICEKAGKKSLSRGSQLATDNEETAREPLQD